MATMRAIQNPYQSKSMFRQMYDNGAVIVMDAADTQCLKCNVATGKGSCRDCRLVRFNAALNVTVEQLVSLPEKVNDMQVCQREDWCKVATCYASIYTGSNDFLKAMNQTWQTRKSLTVGQMRGILNVIRAENIRSRQEAGTVEQAAAPVTKNYRPINDGYYTVAFEDGSHVTLRIKTVSAKQSRDGKEHRYAAYLSGPTNTRDYTRFAFVNSESYRVFKSAAHLSKQTAALDVLMTSDDQKLTEFGKAYAMASGNCYVCGKLLTDPESVSQGIGPICRGDK